MKKYSTLNSKMIINHRFVPLLLTYGALLSAQPVEAASLGAIDREVFSNQAKERGGIVSVMVTVQDISPDIIKSKGLASIRNSVEKDVAGIRAILGDEMLKSAYWNNGMGQVGMLVTMRGLSLLEQSGMAKLIQVDETRSLRDRAWMSKSTQSLIEKSLSINGVAEVDIGLNIDGDYSIGKKGGGIYQASLSKSSSRMKAINSLLESDAGKGLKFFESNHSNSEVSDIVRARIDWATYYALRMAPEVRSLRISGSQEESIWPDSVLDHAYKFGEAEVVITLQGGENYSPNQGYMSEAAWKVQSLENQEAFNKILESVDYVGANNVQNYAGIGSFAVRLSAEKLRLLYAKKDARIRALALARPVANASLANSTIQVNMPNAWAAGVRGAGQLIIMMDSGVLKDHTLLKNASGSSRVSNEACFGTNDGNFYSICPYPNSFGDSVVGTVGSGKPGSASSYFCTLNFPICSHGTHLAGVAAGRSNAVLPTGIQGIAPDASIVAVQVFSFSTVASQGFRVYNVDLLAALNAVYSSTTPNVVNPYTINMSLGAGAYGGTCDSVETAITLSVANLNSRGVPVVAATGNEGNSSGINFPACVSKVIKVSSVKNDSGGTTKTSNANIAHPVHYDGPIFLAPGGDVNGGQVQSAGIATPTEIIGISGTSVAAAHVSGFYAAIKGADPQASVADVSAYISSAAGSISAPQNTSSGIYGFRRIRTSF